MKCLSFSRGPALPKFFCATIALTLAICGSGATAAEPTITAKSNEAKNLARMNCGAQIECITPDGQYTPIALSGQNGNGASVLIMDDDTVSCPLREGDTIFIVTLGRSSTLDRLSFVNENAAARGELRIAVSNDKLPANSDKWTPVDGSVAFHHKRLFNFSLLGVEAKFVRLTFHVQREGRIAALGLYGDRTINDFAAQESGIIRASNSLHSLNPADTVNFNFANLYARAHVVYVSSGRRGLAGRMIDDDTLTAFDFAPNDPHPTVIVELGEKERLNRVSALYKMQRGHIDIFLLDNLPENPGDLSGLHPVSSVEDAGANGKAAMDFNPQGARYVALRWTPQPKSSDTKDFGSTFANRGERTGFQITEISAFGDVPLSELAAAQGAPDLFASNQLGIFPGEGGTDLSNSLGTLAVPPVIPPVSE